MIVNILSRAPLEVFLEFADTAALENVPRATLTLVAGYSLATLLIAGISIYDANVTAKKINLDIEEKKLKEEKTRWKEMTR
jgi:formate dehydrogenase assembly factor FdhD